MTLTTRLVAVAACAALAFSSSAADRRRAVKKPDQSHFCDFGSDVPGVTVPADLCIRKFSSMPTPRVMIFAPNGDLLVSSPKRRTPGGAPNGDGAIYLFRESAPGVAPQKFVFATGDAYESVHALLIQNNKLYYSVENAILAVPYKAGDTAISTVTPEKIADLTPSPINSNRARWTHSLAALSDGTIYTSSGQFDNPQCPAPDSRQGGVMRIGPSSDPRGDVVADGMRDALFIRCMPWNKCYAAELSGDGWTSSGGKEKLIELADGEHYGYPCCVDRGIPAPEQTPSTDCSNVSTFHHSFQLHDTPFGFDWERNFGWPEKYKGAFFVALHGEFNTWIHAGLKWAPTDPVTHMPSKEPEDLATGFGRSGAIPRPTDVLFAPDGRLFFSDDTGGGIYWIAPRSLARTNH